MSDGAVNWVERQYSGGNWRTSPQGVLGLEQGVSGVSPTHADIQNNCHAAFGQDVFDSSHLGLLNLNWSIGYALTLGVLVASVQAKGIELLEGEAPGRARRRKTDLEKAC